MALRPTTLERAFALARTGDYPGFSEIRSQIRAEGYDVHQLDGPSLARQLRDLCAASKKPDTAS
jgi:hypothetical protein